MEVHAHTHTARKKWTHYFWEFFMLFLAVTLGFFVENQREHYVEHNRAKVFARLLVDDLAADTAELNRASKVLNKIITAGDSLAQLLSSDETKKNPGGRLYYYEYWSGWRWSVISRDATLQQLKNSGALRYLGDISIIRNILNYEESIRVIYMLQNKYEPEKSQNWNLVQRVFDQGYFNILDSIAPRDSTTKHFEMTDPKLSAFLNSNFPLYTYDKNLLQELRNWACSRKIISITEVSGMQGDVITLAEIFKYKETGFDKNRKILGQFQSTGTVPSFVQEIKDKGGFVPMEIFSNDPPKASATPNTIPKKAG